MTPHARIQALEARVQKLADAITALTLRLDLLKAPEIEVRPAAAEYVPQFSQWPKDVGG